MDLTTLTIGGLGGGIIGASLAAVLVGGLARGKQIDEAQEEVNARLDTAAVGARGFGLGAVHGAVPRDLLRDSGPGGAAEVDELRQRIRKLEGQLAHRDAQLAELQQYVSAWASRCEGLAFGSVEAGSDVASLLRNGGAT